MRIKSGFLLKDIAGWHIVVPVGKLAQDFSAIISLNDTGSYIWKLLSSDDMSYDELLKRILEEYEVDEEVAKADLNEFLKSAKEAGVLEE